MLQTTFPRPRRALSFDDGKNAFVHIMFVGFIPCDCQRWCTLVVHASVNVRACVLYQVIGYGCMIQNKKRDFEVLYRKAHGTCVLGENRVVPCMHSVPVSSIAISGVHTISEKTLISLSRVHRAEPWFLQRPRVGHRSYINCVRGPMILTVPQSPQQVSR